MRREVATDLQHGAQACTHAYRVPQCESGGWFGLELVRLGNLERGVQTEPTGFHLAKDAIGDEQLVDAGRAEGAGGDDRDLLTGRDSFDDQPIGSGAVTKQLR